MVEKLFLKLSGEHPTLPFSEALAIIEAEGFPYKLLSRFEQVLRLEAPLKVFQGIYERAAMTMLCCEELFHCKALKDDIYKSCRDVDWSFLVGGNFAVKVDRVRGSSPHIKTSELERGLGALINKGCGGKAYVNLEKPSTVLQGVLTEDTFIFGVLMRKIDRGSFNRRKPRTRPFFHPGVMAPKIARVFVNLARARKGSVFLDPFSGTGSLLIEAALIGCQILGSDIDGRMVKGCKMNLRHYGVRPLGLAIADARKLPFPHFDCVATDPPYARVTSSRGIEVKSLIEGFISEASLRIRGGGCMCIASPSWVNMFEIADKHGFKVMEVHEVKVHRSLTRHISTLIKH